MYKDKGVKIVFNPNAHKGKSVIFLKYLKSKLDEYEMVYTVLETKKTKGRNMLSIENIDDNDILFIVGGDGTVHGTINGTANKVNIRYCIVPAGTGNDLYRAMESKFSIEKILENIKSDTTKKCDIIFVNEEIKMSLFLAYGIVIDIIMRCRKGKKKNKYCYLKSAAKAIFSYKPKQFEYSIEGGKTVKVRADYIGIHNASKAGGGILISPFSKIDDNKFEFIVLEYKGIFRRILNFISLVRKEIEKQPNYKSITCGNATIKSLQDKICCVDGEILQSREIVAKVNNQITKFFV